MTILMLFVQIASGEKRKDNSQAEGIIIVPCFKLLGSWAVEQGISKALMIIISLSGRGFVTRRRRCVFNNKKNKKKHRFVYYAKESRNKNESRKEKRKV